MSSMACSSISSARLHPWPTQPEDVLVQVLAAPDIEAERTLAINCVAGELRPFRVSPRPVRGP